MRSGTGSSRSTATASSALRVALRTGILRGTVSPENVEIVQAAFEAWNGGDMDALRELQDPDVISRLLEGWPEPGPLVSREAIMRQFEQQRGCREVHLAWRGPRP